jgi:hypothetical protein
VGRLDDLDRRSSTWVDAGLITPDQRDAIRRFEAEAEAEAPRRLSLGAEVAVYVGSVFALSGGAMAIGNAWSDLAFGGRLAVAITIAVIGVAVGQWLFSFGEAGTDRVAGYVTTLGVGGVSFVAGLLADEFGGRDSAWMGVAVGAGMLVASIALWRNLDRPLQALSALLGFGITVGAFVDAVDGEAVVAGLVLIAVGVALFVAAHVESLRPALVVEMGAGALAYVGGFMLWDISERFAPAVATVIALLVVVYGVRFEQLVLMVLGILGATIAATSLLAATFEGAASAAVVALLGLIVVVVVVTRSLRDRNGPASRLPPPAVG